MAETWLDQVGGEVVPDAPREGGLFWKPELPSYIVGKLDRIEPGKQYGDYAIFREAVVFRSEDHKPQYYREELAIPHSANLEGKITPQDAGQYFAVVFMKWVNTKSGRMRVFEVRMGLDPSRTSAVLLKARKAIDAETIAPPQDPNDGLPF